jgi:hypothetical protein
MRKLKLYEAHKVDAKMESDMRDIFIELEDMGMSVRVQSPDALGYSFVIIKQEHIPELDSVETYSDQQEKFLDKKTNFNSLIEIDKPLFESIFEMFMEYMEKEGRHLFMITYKEPFNQSVSRTIYGRFADDDYIGEKTNYGILKHILKGKKLEKLEIYFKEKVI